MVDEVDIGVGIQTFVTGWECEEHGTICGLCSGCGIACVDGAEHREWCPELKINDKDYVF